MIRCCPVTTALAGLTAVVCLVVLQANKKSKIEKDAKKSKSPELFRASGLFSARVLVALSAACDL